MRDSLDADAIWVMVEDEFLPTARLFTQHLHHAEYQRLKHTVNTTVANIQRPTDGRTKMSAQSKMKVQAGLQRQQSRIAVTNVHGNDAEESEDDDPWMKDPRLAGLMSTKEVSAPLRKIAGVTTKTRASEGFKEVHKSPVKRPFDLARVGRPSQSQSAPVAPEPDPEEDAEDEDDLDAPSYYKKKAPLSLKKGFSPAVVKREPQITKEPPDKQRTAGWRAKPQYRFKPTTPDSSPPDTSPSDDEISTLRRHGTNYSSNFSKSVLDRSKKRREEEEKQRKTIKVEDVPTFMF